MMKLAILVPTFGRPRLIENTLAQYMAQDYPAEYRRMLILDDAGQLPEQIDPEQSWEVYSTPDRYPSLPHKYQDLIATAGDWPDAYVVWDDDDVYGPAYLSAHMHALVTHPWSHPSHVWSLYTGQPVLEAADGRFHGALAIRRDLCEQVGGWVGVMEPGHERRADFDQRMIAACRRVGGEPGRPDQELPPSQYVFRWASTQAPHCQGLMTSPDNEDWYDRYPAASISPVQRLERVMDPETQSLHAWLGRAG